MKVFVQVADASFTVRNDADEVALSYTLKDFELTCDVARMSTCATEVGEQIVKLIESLPLK